MIKLSICVLFSSIDKNFSATLKNWAVTVAETDKRSLKIFKTRRYWEVVELVRKVTKREAEERNRVLLYVESLSREFVVFTDELFQTLTPIMFRYHKRLNRSKRSSGNFVDLLNVSVIARELFNWPSNSNFQLARFDLCSIRCHLHWKHHWVVVAILCHCDTDQNLNYEHSKRQKCKCRQSDIKQILDSNRLHAASNRRRMISRLRWVVWITTLWWRWTVIIAWKQITSVDDVYRSEKLN